ncbi:MAG: hypothetical protein KGI98_04580 [Euryarchaeota archaeon]|nr:hypothetical protein [Euryarchaeota archaeon]
MAAPPTLSQMLGLHGQQNFLVQHQMLSLGHSYRVMDSNKSTLFMVQGDAGQNIGGNLLGSAMGGGYLGRMATRSVNMTYALNNGSGQRCATLKKEGGSNSSTFTLVDNAGAPHVLITLNRGLMAGMQASAVYPNGQPLLSTSGNLMRHNFFIKNAQGQDCAKVHEAWVAIRDTYNIDMLAPIDPIFPLVFAVAIDYEKVK